MMLLHMPLHQCLNGHHIWELYKLKFIRWVHHASFHHCLLCKALKALLHEVLQAGGTEPRTAKGIGCSHTVGIHSPVL